MPGLIGVDVGGTFTDVVVWRDGILTGRKVPTTEEQWQGVAAAVEGSTEDRFLHGTTVATNALLEGKGARLALVTGAGYEDLIEIGRQDRPSLYDSRVDRPTPLVDRTLRLGFTGDMEDLLATLADVKPEAVVVGLLESYLDPTGEREVAHHLRRALDIPVLESSQVSPEFREYERLATTLLSAYLTPAVADYLRALDQVLPMKSRLVMTSSGGLILFSQAPQIAGRLVLSGPAGGAVAAAALGAYHGASMVLSFDMGGTSTDVCRITGGELAVGSGHAVAGRVNRVPSVPIRTIGAGGGSIGWIDPGGALRVGPHSAGASPGPAAYGIGGQEPTVTDANLVTGRIPAGLALAGSVPLHLELSRQALDRIGERIGMKAEAVAEGMLEVVDTHMENALRSVSVEEGADPREGALVAFGGAGGLHAGALARRALLLRADQLLRQLAHLDQETEFVLLCRPDDVAALYPAHALLQQCFFCGPGARAGVHASPGRPVWSVLWLEGRRLLVDVGALVVVLASTVTGVHGGDVADARPGGAAAFPGWWVRRRRYVPVMIGRFGCRPGHALPHRGR